MKKITISFLLLFVLSLTAFAEGEIHTGGRSCPQNQTCLVEPDQIESENDNPIILAVKNFIRFIF